MYMSELIATFSKRFGSDNDDDFGAWYASLDLSSTLSVGNFKKAFTSESTALIELRKL